MDSPELSGRTTPPKPETVTVQSQQKASLAKGTVTVPQSRSVQLEVEVLQKRVFGNGDDVIGFMSVRELEENDIASLFSTMGN
jgi:hypothetical protein